MKSLVLLLSLMGPLAAWSAETLSGTLIRNGDTLSIRLDSDGHIHRLVAGRPDVQKVFARLSTDDAIVGSADIDAARGVVQMQTLDFVGLRKIIGYWSSASTSAGVINFKSYSDMNVYTLANPNGGARLSRQFKYTIAPSGGSDWAFFLADQSKTQVGLLDLREQQATLRLFDPNTGDLTQILRLQKITQ